MPNGRWSKKTIDGCMHTPVSRTILYLTQRCPLETSKDNSPTVRQDVRQYTQSCVTCQIMTTTNQIIRDLLLRLWSRCNASPWTPLDRSRRLWLSNLSFSSYRHIHLLCGTISVPNCFGSISSECTMVTHMSVLYTHRDHYWQGVTDHEMNQTLTQLTTISRIWFHHLSIPYSTEENGIVERANKEVNRHIRNILVDKNCMHESPQVLCMTE